MADLTKPGTIPPVNMSKPSLARDLIITATQAYKLNPGNCSGAVNWVIINMVDPQMPYLVANQLMTRPYVIPGFRDFRKTRHSAT